jgi:hypothetical protein
VYIYDNCYHRTTWSESKVSEREIKKLHENLYITKNDREEFSYILFVYKYTHENVGYIMLWYTMIYGFKLITVGGISNYTVNVKFLDNYYRLRKKLL